MIQVELGLGLRISTYDPSDAITAKPGATLWEPIFCSVMSLIKLGILL